MVQQGHVPSEALGENPFPCLSFPVPWGCLRFLALGPASLWPLLPFSSLLSPSWLCLLCLPLRRTPMITLGHQDNLGPFPHIKIHDLITSAKSFCHVRQHNDSVQGLGCRHLWGDIFPACHTPIHLPIPLRFSERFSRKCYKHLGGSFLCEYI